MIIVLFLLFLILWIIFMCLIDHDEELFFGLSAIFGILSFISFVALILLAVNLSIGKTIDDRMSMYQEQNQKIEKDISVLVENYMNYESETFKECSSDSSITLVSLYPELKSDSLVEQQCTLYITNNEKIIELKEQQINLKIIKWWLYFGK